MPDNDDQRWEKFINVFESARRKAWDKLNGAVSLGPSYQRMKDCVVVTASAKDLKLVMTFEVNKKGDVSMHNNPRIVAEVPNIHSDRVADVIAETIVDVVERSRS